MVEYREATPQELAFVDEVVVRYGSRRVPGEYSKVVVAVEDGKVVAFLLGQVVLHFEPMWAKDGSSGRVFLPRLVEEMKKLFVGQRFYSFIPQGFESLAKRAGMTEQPWKVFMGGE